MNHRIARFPLFAFLIAACCTAVADERAPAANGAPSSQAQAAQADAKARDAASACVEADVMRHELDSMREQMRELSRKMADLSLKMGDVGPRAYAFRYLGDPDRGMLGMVLAKDEHGARVTAVTPGGPAEKAGIRNGDLIVSLRGDLDGKAGDPAQFLTEALRNLKVGQELKLTVKRDGGKTELTIGVKAERREPYNFADVFATPEGLGELGSLGELGALPPDFGKQVNEQVQQALRQAQNAERVAESNGKRASEQAQRALEHLSVSTPWWGLNLASLNPDLGSYFGADKGVLVLSADQDSLNGLKSGDILLEVAEQKVDRPEDALRLLREQPAGSEVKIQVLRQHKALTVSMQAPDFKNIFVPPPPAPIPPAPPAPNVAPPPPPALPPPRPPILPPAPPAPPASSENKDT